MGALLSVCLDVSSFNLKSPSIILVVDSEKGNQKIHVEELFLMSITCHNNIADVHMRTNAQNSTERQLTDPQNQDWENWRCLCQLCHSIPAHPEPQP